MATVVRSRKLELLFQQSFPAIFVSLAAAVLLVFILWPVQQHQLLLSWLGVLFLTAVVRLILFVRYRRANPHGEELLSWEKPYFLTLLSTTLTWGIGAAVILPTDSVIHQVVILCFMIGLSGGAISLYSAHSLMTSVTISVLMAPITSRFLVQGDVLMLELVFAALLFYISSIRAANFIASTLQKNFTLTHELQESKERYQRLVDEVGDKFVLYSLEAGSGAVRYVTGGFASIFGLPKEQVLGHPWQDAVSWIADSVKTAEQRLAMLVSGKSNFFQIDMAFIHRDGRKRSVRVAAHPVRDDDGKVLTIDGLLEDVTLEKFMEEKLHLAASVFDNSQDGILITDPEGIVEDVNEACCEITGYSREEIIGSNPSMFSSGRHSREFYEDLWAELSESGQWQGEIWNRRRDGDVYAQRISIDAVSDEQGVLEHYVAVFHDISYLKEHEAELQHMAYYDVLTGLPNRLLFRDRINLALRQSDRQQCGLAVCYLDLDGFKPINDTYGHNAGDQVLVEIAERIQNGVRATDTVARIGGDEFVVLVTDYGSKDTLEEILGRILQVVAEPCELVFGEVSVSASIGVALVPEDGDEVDQLMRRADRAMYIAKSLGRNRYQYYS